MAFKRQYDLAKSIRIRQALLKECLGEFVGTAILLIFGAGVLAQVILGDNGRFEHGSFICISVGWGFAVMMGVYFAGKSGKGIINPSVTLAFALTGKINWRKAPFYMLAQYLGAFTGSLLVFLTYVEKIYDYAEKHDNNTLRVHSTGNIFVTNPHASLLTCFWDQIFGTALLAGGAYAIIDKRSFNLPDWSHPIAIGIMVTTIVGCFALNAGAALNPARDLGPRVMLAICGWGSEAFTAGNCYFWVPVVGPYIGACLGAAAYELTIGIHLPGEPVQSAVSEIPLDAINHDANQAKDNGKEMSSKLLVQGHETHDIDDLDDVKFN